MKKFLAFALLSGAVTLSFAEERQTPTEAFREITQFHIMICKIKTQTELNKVELGQSTSAVAPISACIKEGRIEAKKLYPAALGKVAKKPAASKLLKDYYAAWLTSLDGVMPNPSETKLRYSQRLEAAEAKYDEIWTRFEIEAGI